MNRLRQGLGLISYMLLLFQPTTGQAQEFDQCPSAAYLVQGNNAHIYGVNLATGAYELLSNDMGTTGKLNAIGFNNFDRYIYGYSTEFKSLVRIDSSFQVTSLTATQQPSGNFYVGDVSPAENAMYLYLPGSSYGLYRVSLDQASEDYLVFNRIISGANLSLRIFDFAFHPQNQQLYSVDATGVLHQIDPATGNATSLGNVGESGTFGAVYFDKTGNFYISRNSDGHIFRIDTSAAEPAADFFAFGPSSSNNDGARCTSSDILDDVATIDFGNAPSSYGNSLEDNGARHGQSDELFLGDHWGGDNDGVTTVTNIQRGSKAVIVVKAKGDGYLNAWADFDQSGDFNADESICNDCPVSEGSNLVLLDVPENAETGETWARFRLSSRTDLGPNGGVSDGEVEDYNIRIDVEGTSVYSYPSSSEFATIAYEDNWPEKGDYDMNDVVLAMRTHRFVNAEDEVTRYDIEGQILALGADYANGMAVQLDGVASQNIDISATRLFVNGYEQINTPLEQNSPSADAVFIIDENITAQFERSDNCPFYRTQAHCTSMEARDTFFFRLVITLAEPQDAQTAPKDLLNPFVFATPGHYHGAAFATPPGRGLEIHLKNHRVSERFNSDYFGISDDASNTDNQFINAQGLPWALRLPTLWHHPRERTDITQAYPQFFEFVTSSGQRNTTWYMPSQANSEKTVDNSTGILR